jgi:hypothetical protein
VISRYESADSEDSLTEPASSRRRWWNVPFACDVRCGTVERAKTFVFLPQGDSYAPDFLILMILLTETSPAFAQGNMGTPQEQQACRRDAHRFCQRQLDNDGAVQQCLQQNRTKLSQSCQKVFASHGM